MAKENKMIFRDIVLKGVPLTVWFWFYKGWPDNEFEQGADDEIEIESVFVDDVNVFHLMGSTTLKEIEAELFKILDNGEW